MAGSTQCKEFIQKYIGLEEDSSIIYRNRVAMLSALLCSSYLSGGHHEGAVPPLMPALWTHPCSVPLVLVTPYTHLVYILQTFLAQLKPSPAKNTVTTEALIMVARWRLQAAL